MKRQFKCSVKGGDLPNDFQAMINVEMDFEGVKIEDVIDCAISGSSARVRLQSKLRKLPPATLKRYELEGHKCTFASVMARGTTQMSYKDALRQMDKDECVKTLMEDLDVTEEQALHFYENVL